MAEKKTLDGDINTTGHEWDGIREYDNPLPRWWLWTFYATILWSVAYCIAMPAVPLVDSFTKGVLGYASRTELATSMEELAAQRSSFMEQMEGKSLQEIADNPELFAFALAGGKSAFGVNCAPCHGTGAAGSKGYPNLNDDDWMWGGTLDEIAMTLRVGIRSTHPETRYNIMSAFLKDGILDATQVEDAANYVLQVSGQEHEAEAALRGQAVFAEQCAACHGVDAKGLKELGAPNLTDGIWLFGGDKASLVETISNGRGGVMPAWEGRLSAETLQLVTIYVHSLGGGQ